MQTSSPDTTKNVRAAPMYLQSKEIDIKEFHHYHKGYKYPVSLRVNGSCHFPLPHYNVATSVSPSYEGAAS